MEFMWKIESAKSEKQGSVVLQKINGTATAGEVYAILGTAGSGKKMLLEALTKLNVDFDCKADYWIDMKGVTKETFAESFDSVPSVLDFSGSNQKVYDFLLAAESDKSPKVRGIKKEHVDFVIEMLDWGTTAGQLVSELSEEHWKCLAIISSLLGCRKAICIEESCLNIPSLLVSKVVKVLIQLAKLKKIFVLMSISLSKEYNQSYELIKGGTLLYGGKMLCQGEWTGLNLIYKRLPYVFLSNLDPCYPLRTLFDIFGSETIRDVNCFGNFIEEFESAFSKEKTTDFFEVCYKNNLMSIRNMRKFPVEVLLEIISFFGSTGFNGLLLTSHTFSNLYAPQMKRFIYAKMFDMDTQPNFRFFEDGNLMCATVLSIFESGFSKEDITIIIEENRKKVWFNANRIGAELKKDHSVVIIPDYLQFDRVEWYEGNEILLIIFAKVKPDAVLPPEMLQLKPVKE